MMPANQEGSSVVADVTTIFGDSISEEPEPLESPDRVVDRIRTGLIEALTSTWQLDSDS